MNDFHVKIEWKSCWHSHEFHFNLVYVIITLNYSREFHFTWISFHVYCRISLEFHLKSVWETTGDWCEISMDRQSLNIVHLLLGFSTRCTNKFSITKTLFRTIRHGRIKFYRRKGYRPFNCVRLFKTFDLQGATNVCKLWKSIGFRDFLTKYWLVVHACCVPPLPWEIDHAR